jgi:hypothetical protein
MRVSRLIPSAIASIGIAALAPAVAQADAAQATTTAATHAGMAATNADIAVVQRHLHHVLNCLVGPEGEGFDQAAGNPCAAAGGAIPQTADAATKEMLTKTAADVTAAIAHTDLAAAQAAATAVQKALTEPVLK